MSDGNKNISVNIEISTHSQQQLNFYKSAFDGLRTSINNLSNPINRLNSEISKLSTASNDLGSKTDFISDSAVRVKDNFLALGNIFDAVKKGMTMLKAGTLSLTTALTGGLSLILTFAPEIISLVSSFFRGKQAVAQMTDKLKGFNEIIKAANSDTAAQTAKLNLLYKSATDLKKSDDERAESIRLLKKEFPGYFEHLGTEDIKNGKANDAYLKLTRTLIDNARAKAALNKITEESAKILDVVYEIPLKPHLANNLAIAI